MDLDRIEEQLYSLERSPLRLSIDNGDGKVVAGNYSRCYNEIEEPLDYIVLLGKIPTHTIYRFLMKIRVGGMLVVEVEDKDATVIRDIVDFLNNVASQHAWYYFVDGIRYLFVVRMDN